MNREENRLQGERGRTVSYAVRYLVLACAEAEAGP